MIARIWTCATRAADAEAYEEYMQEVAPPGCANVTGNRVVLMLRRAATMTAPNSLWSLSRQMQSVIASSGPDPDRAVFYPRRTVPR